MIPESLLVILVALIICVLWELNNRWISVTKTSYGTESKVTIKVHTDLELIRFEDTPKEDKNEKLEFRRKDLKRGELIEFLYPLSLKTIFITAIKKGHERKFEVRCN